MLQARIVHPTSNIATQALASLKDVGTQSPLCLPGSTYIALTGSPLEMVLEGFKGLSLEHCERIQSYVNRIHDLLHDIHFAVEPDGPLQPLA